MGSRRFTRLAGIAALGAALTGCGGSAALAPPIAASAAGSVTRLSCQEPFSETFKGKTLNPCWTVSSPNPDSSIGLTGKTLLMHASPLNGGSDLWYSSNYNAPIILQPVPGNLDWTITVKQNFNPTNYFQGAGILLAYQPGGFTSTSQFIRLSERKDQNTQEMCGYTCVSYGGQKQYLRVIKKGLTYTSEFSTNGKNWTSLGSGTVSNAYTWIGLDSMRQPWDGNDSVYSDAYYYYFKVKVAKN